MLGLHRFVDQPQNALHLKRLVPRRACIDEHHGGLTLNHDAIRVVVDARQARHPHALPSGDGASTLASRSQVGCGALK